MASEIKEEIDVRKPAPNTHIWLDAQGVAWIGKTNMKVIELATDKIAHENSAEEMHRQHPHVSLAEIHAGLSYYYDHQAEFDAKIEASYKEAQRLWEENRNTPLHRKLRELRQQR